MPIDNHFIEAAIRIRRKYVTIQSGIGNYEVLAKKLTDDLQSSISKFEGLKTDIDDNTLTSAKSAESKIVSIIGQLEVDMNKIISNVDNLNKQIESLRVQEKTLYDRIKKKHPTLKDSEIISQINESLKENNL